MQKEDKERVVAELTEKLRTSDTLIVADYRGLTMPQIDDLRSKLVEHGARFNVVKNTLTRRAAEAAGADALLALLDGPSAIAFIEADGDAVAVAKALADAARDTRVLEIRGGIMQGRPISGGEVESLAKLPPFDVLRSQVLAAVIAPLTAIAALVNAPLQNLYGLIDARIEQLGAEGGDTGQAAEVQTTDVETTDAEPTDVETTDAQTTDAQTTDDAEPEPAQADEPADTQEA